MAENKVNPGLDPSLDARILRALAAAPRTEIPAGFAARVAARVPMTVPVSLSPGRYGHLAAVACLVVLAVLMLSFAHRATATSLYLFSIESVFCAQFALLSVWLVARKAGYKVI